MKKINKKDTNNYVTWYHVTIIFSVTAIIFLLYLTVSDIIRLNINEYQLGYCKYLNKDNIDKTLACYGTYRNRYDYISGEKIK